MLYFSVFSGCLNIIIISKRSVSKYKDYLVGHLTKVESTWWLVASKKWISEKFSPCFCLPFGLAIPIKKASDNLVTLFVLATSLHSVALGASLCEDLLSCVCAHLLLWKWKCFLSRILGSLYFLRTDHFILSRWDTWEEKLFHPNFDLPSPQPLWPWNTQVLPRHQFLTARHSQGHEFWFLSG